MDTIDLIFNELKPAGAGGFIDKMLKPALREKQPVITMAEKLRASRAGALVTASKEKLGSNARKYALAGSSGSKALLKGGGQKEYEAATKKARESLGYTGKYY